MVPVEEDRIAIRARDGKVRDDLHSKERPSSFMPARLH